MAAPLEVNLKNFDGRWIMNKELSDPYEPVLKLQGVNWLMRKVMKLASVTMTIRQREQDGITIIHVEHRSGSDLPPTTEDRVLDYQDVEINHPLFGKVSSKTRWANTAELDKVDKFLARGFEKGEDQCETEFVHVMTDHLEAGVVTHQVWGFEMIGNFRYQTRHVIVKKNEDIVQARLVYDYLGAPMAESS